MIALGFALLELKISSYLQVHHHCLHWKLFLCHLQSLDPNWHLRLVFTSVVWLPWHQFEWFSFHHLGFFEVKLKIFLIFSSKPSLLISSRFHFHLYNFLILSFPDTSNSNRHLNFIGSLNTANNHHHYINCWILDFCRAWRLEFIFDCS
jgi:hypothetical protein